MEVAQGGVTLQAEVSGPTDGPPIVFAHSLGATLHLWDPVLPHLPDGLRIIRYDLRGHGRSDVPDAPYTMGQLVSDAAAVCDAANAHDALFVGISVGGMIAQGLAVKRPDLIRAMVLSNTAAKIGNPKMWQDRINDVQAAGMAGIADDVIQRWFGRDFLRASMVTAWREMLEATPAEGYMGVCAAIDRTDFYTPTSGLRIPTLGIAGSDDITTPPDLVRETTDLIPGSQFVLMRRVGHLPCVEAPEAYAAHLTAFMKAIGHL
ncbi:MAG: 3-oxoadipate enol-lactonase [Pseudomonadota bacterium]